MALSAEATATYWKQGYLLLPGFFAREALDTWEARFLEIASGRCAPPEGMTVMRDVAFVRGDARGETPVHEVNKLLSFEEDEVLFAYARDAKLLDVVRSIIGPDVMTISTNVFNKPPGIDGRHPIHQDSRYFTLRPLDRIVATWTAISPCERDNGCLVVVPGSHEEGLRKHGMPDWEQVNFGFFAAQDVDLEARVHVEMEPGDTLLFHPLLLHGSGRNRSDGFRRAIAAHYASTACTRPKGPRKRESVTRSIP